MSVVDLTRLAGLVFLAVSCVVLGDTAGKMLTANGADPFFVAWSRFALGALLLLPVSGLRASELRDLWRWPIILRAMLILSGICCILTALRTEPIANVFGGFFIGPVVSYILAIVFLGERPSSWRSISFAVGFLGVMLVVQPGLGMTTGMMFALAAGCFYGGYLVMTKWIAGQVRPRFLLMSQLIIGTVVLAPFAGVAAWPESNVSVWGLIFLSAAGSACGNFLLVLANRRGEASLIAPLTYTQLLTATAIGGLAFGDWPDWVAWTGLALILASGFVILLLTPRT
ncbi:Threonine/homoserine efflux transporter RhtA [Epibacterium ulvae]|uniref:Threonine/homoserine efflux transporter RhtA n=1 Tax=Epibacterium ulvae TaxID=1156985 RepID=A0A1G5PT52_9RHOB|nr:DMT family transporter [Epibacterium ulvae]SCZ52693.1 Threonine/homoserine efflux transporter RhtA [Epibacterium ulvae]